MNAAVTFAGSGNFNILSTVFNTNTLGVRARTKSGSGILTLSASNNYNGETKITTGTLLLKAAGALGTNSLILNGGTLKVDVTGTNESKGNLTLSNSSTIDLGTVSAGVLRFASANSNSWTAAKVLTVANSSIGAKLYITDTSNVALTLIKSADNSNAVASLASDGLLSFSSGIAAPSGLSYANISGTVGTDIGNVNPTVTGGTPTGYSISPALPAGLLFNMSTGVISGTPSVAATSDTYTVTATNEALS